MGMSGGVDSAVSAALLKKSGHDVIGVFIKVWEPEGYKCTWREDRREAMRVAAVLDIPLITLDLSREYEKRVLRSMIREYRAGRTPNPDVECNRAIKFGAFYAWAMSNGADYVATGHYARVGGKDNLLMGKDKNKDQSYFLWTLKPAQLQNCLFPIGEYQKSEVRRLAKKFKLPNFAKKDSQGLCFLGKLDLKKFLQKYLRVKRGKVIDKESGRVVGEHEGAWFYTIGERHHGYIVGKDLAKNLLLVSSKPAGSLNQSVVVSLAGVNWLNGGKFMRDKKYRARIRHRGELYRCLVARNRQAWQVEFLEPPLAPAPGQSLVLYEGERCLGGGVIV